MMNAGKLKSMLPTTKAADPRNMTHDQLMVWIEERLEEARQYRRDRGKPPMTKLEESALWDRYRQAAAR